MISNIMKDLAICIIKYGANNMSNLQEYGYVFSLYHGWVKLVSTQEFNRYYIERTINVTNGVVVQPRIYEGCYAECDDFCITYTGMVQGVWYKGQGFLADCSKVYGILALQPMRIEDFFGKNMGILKCSKADFKRMICMG